MRALAFLLIAGPLLAQPGPPTDTLRIYYVGKAVGYERFTLVSNADGHVLMANVDYIDRGRRVRVDGTVEASPNFDTRGIQLARGGEQLTPDAKLVPGKGVAIVGHAPASQHLMLMRWWEGHGRPKTFSATMGGGVVNPVSIAFTASETIGGKKLDRYTVNGVNWGNETVWLDPRGNFVGLATRAGNLTFAAVRTDLEPYFDKLMASATRDRMRELAALSAPVKPVASAAKGSIALVGVTVVDATGGPAKLDQTVLVTDGRIAAIGASATMRLASSVHVIDAKGKTILPGLWDMHAHLTQMERAPGYLAVGVTSARDMGSELDFIVQLRKTIDAGSGLGPKLYLAGLVDGGGPNSFGQIDARTPDEGRAVVRRYHELGFPQIKVYNQLKADVVGAITREAHALGMTVTGHVPNALGLRAAIDSGQDQIAHLAINGDAKSDSVKALIAWIKSKGTVFDPTPSWNELNGHPTKEPVAYLVPGVDALPAVLKQRIAAMGSAGDSAQARNRLTRSLEIIKALHDAGVPVVAGTDMGVPGFSVYREIEIYEEAGFSRIDAIRTATAVAAQAMGVAKDVGTIEVGKRADLIILDANPLESLRNLYTTRMVMKGGVLYRTADIAKAIGYAPENAR